MTAAPPVLTWIDLPDDFGTLGVPVPFCNGVRFGDLVVVTGQTGRMPSAAEGVEPGESPRDQAHRALVDLDDILGAAGAGRDDVVRVNSYYRGPATWLESFAPQAEHFLAGPAHTSTDVVGLMMPCYDIEIDVLAVVGGTRAFAHFRPGRPVPAGAPFHAGVRASDLVFVSARLDVDDDGRVRHEGIAEQTGAVLDDIAAILAQLGAGLGDVVKTSVCLVDGEDWSASAQVRSERLAHGVATTDVVVGSLGADGARVQIEATARIGGAAEFADPAGVTVWPEPTSFHAGVRAGDLVFTSAQVPLAADGSVRHAGDIAAQTRVVMDNLRAVVGSFGLPMDAVLRKNTFYVDLAPESWVDAAQVRAEYFTKGPCATGVGVAGGVRPGIRIAAEAIAAAHA